MIRLLMRYLSLLTISIITFYSLLTPNITLASSKGFMIVSGLYTPSGDNYSPKYSSVQDSEDANNMFWVTQEALTSLKSFQGFGIGVEFIVMMGGGLFIGLDGSAQYREDGVTTNTGQTKDYLESQIRNSFGSVGIEFGGRTIKEKSRMGLYATGSIGAMFNTLEGQYPASANKKISGASPYTLSGGQTEVYYSDMSVTQYYVMFKGGIEAKVGKGNNASTVLAGIRYMYTDDLSVPREDVTDISVELPTGTATSSGSSSQDRALTKDDVKLPIYPANRYFLQGLIFRSWMLELGIKFEFEM